MNEQRDKVVELKLRANGLKIYVGIHGATIEVDQGAKGGPSPVRLTMVDRAEIKAVADALTGILGRK